MFVAAADKQSADVDCHTRGGIRATRERKGKTEVEAGKQAKTTSPHVWFCCVFCKVKLLLAINWFRVASLLKSN
jgi:hypothetical protein